MNRAADLLLVIAALLAGVYLVGANLRRWAGEASRPLIEEAAVALGVYPAGEVARVPAADLAAGVGRELMNRFGPWAVLAGVLLGGLKLLAGSAGWHVLTRAGVLGFAVGAAVAILRRTGAWDGLAEQLGLPVEPCGRFGGVEYEMGLTTGGVPLYSCADDPWVFQGGRHYQNPPPP